MAAHNGATRLRDFLNGFWCKKGSKHVDAPPPTHVALDRGAWYVPGTHMEEFMRRYGEAVQGGSPGLALVEMHRHICPVVVDLDFRAPAAAASPQQRMNQEQTPAKLYAPEEVTQFLSRLMRELSLLVDLRQAAAGASSEAAGGAIDVYVLEKPARLDAKHGRTKDGLHIVIPDVVTAPEVQHMLRERMLPFVGSNMRHLAGEGRGPGDVYDEAVIEKNGWLMYGSRKPEEESSWTLTRMFLYDPGCEGLQEESEGRVAALAAAPAALAARLSIRNKYDETRLATEAVAAEVQARRAAAHERQTSRQAALSITPVEAAAQERDVEAWVRMLSPRRAVLYDSWVKVGLALHHSSGGAAWGHRLFQAFSASADGVTPGAYDREGCERTWDRFKQAGPATGRPLSAGSLRIWAKEDSPDAWSAWFRGQLRALCNQQTMSARAQGDEAEEGPISQAVSLEAATREAQRALAALGQSSAHEWSVTQACVSSDPRGGHASLRVQLLDGESRTAQLCVDMEALRATLVAEGQVQLAAGYLHGREPIAVRGTELGAVHRDVPRGASWSVMRPSETMALFETEDKQARIELLNMDQPGTEAAMLAVVDRPRSKVAKGELRTLCAAYTGAVRHHVRTALVPSLGVTLAIIGDRNNVTVNIGDAGAEEQGGGGRRNRDDGLLAEAWTAFMRDSVCVEEQGPARLVYDCAGSFYYFQDGLWVKREKALAANELVAHMKQVAGGSFWKERLGPEERHYIGTVRGRAALLTCLMNALADPGFEQRLDAQLNLLPFSNGVMDLESLEFRALRWDDYVSRTVGYSFAPREQVPARDFEAVHAFYEQVLPVVEEREVYLRAAGAALSGDRRGFKHFIVATDKRQGNNGKSTALSSLEHVFGPLAMPSQTNFLYSCTESANSHGANDLAYKGRRVGVFDETSSERAFNLEKIKRVTGGGLKMAVRGANDKTPTEFVWTAVLFIGCNQGNMPRFSASESALMRRMVVIPFRSKFDNAAAEAGEEHAWPMDETTPTKLEQARVAHMHVLLEAYQRFKADGKRLTAPGAPLPLGCVEWRNDVAFSSDPRLEALNGFLTERVNFHLSRGPEQRGKRVLGYIKRDRLLQDFRSWAQQWEQTEVYGDNLLRGSKAEELKALVSVAMEARGRRLCKEINVSGAGHEYNVFKDCELVESGALASGS